MENCLFCKIANHKLDSQIEYEDSEIIAFTDINPKAPVHILIVSKKHISSVAEASDQDALLLGKMILVAKKIAEDKEIAESGYRLVFNTKKNAGQIIDHIHLHLLGGQKLQSMV